jgi:putative Holliday junction resolvase
MPQRILGLDVGDKRIGISMSDPTFSIAQGLKVLTRSSVRGDLEELKSIVSSYEVNEIVIGLPRNLDGTIGQRAQNVMGFAEEVEKHTSVRVVLWDERFSTNEAHRVFDEANLTHRKRKPFIDILSAQIILQGYLDAQKAR